MCLQWRVTHSVAQSVSNVLCCAMDCVASRATTNTRLLLRQNNPTGKSPKVCPAPRAKIFRLTRRANHCSKSARLTRERGGSRSSGTCGFPCALYSTEGERLGSTRAFHAARMRTHTPRCLTVKSEDAAITFRSVAGSHIQRRVRFAPNLGHRAIAIPNLEAALRALRLNRRKKFAGRCRPPKTPFVVPMPSR
jgi:hypothetical protein